MLVRFWKIENNEFHSFCLSICTVCKSLSLNDSYNQSASKFLIKCFRCLLMVVFGPNIIHTTFLSTIFITHRRLLPLRHGLQLKFNNRAQAYVVVVSNPAACWTLLSSPLSLAFVISRMPPNRYIFISNENLAIFKKTTRCIEQIWCKNQSHLAIFWRIFKWSLSKASEII